MKTKHTPGPWTVSEDLQFVIAEDGHASIIETGRHRVENCKPGETRDAMRVECVANAFLIAEAPDLLDCLRRIMRHIPADMGGASLGDDMARAREAIRRATR